CRRLRFDGEHPYARLELLERARHPRHEPASAEGDDHRIHIGQVLEDLEADRAVARHHRLVLHRVDERSRRPVEARLLERLPPALERHLDRPAAQPLDRRHLRLRRVLGDDDRRPHARLAGRPGNPLCHVARARGDDARADRLRSRRTHRVDGAPDLERADRLHALELRPQLARRLGCLQPDERRPHGSAGDRLPGTADGVERDQNSTVSPRPVSRARRTRYSAANRSSTATPSERNTVSSFGDVRPGRWPTTISPSSASIQAPSIFPSTSADSRRSTTSVPSRRVASSSSRPIPTAFTCAPSFSHSRRSTGSGALVATTTTSAPRTASSTDAQATAPASAASACACSHVRLATRTRSKPGRARRCDRACTPAPTMASSRASPRASRRVATAVTAAVRTAVTGDAFMTASVRPVTPSNSVTVPWWASRPRAGLAGTTATVFSAYSGRSPPR